MPGERIRTITLACGLVLVLVSLGSRVSTLRVAGNHRGYSPSQPIAYSHRLHAGELAIDCLYCHTAAERGRHAGIPPAGVCMNCHKAVTATRAAVVAEEKAAMAEERKPRPVVSPELRSTGRSASTTCANAIPRSSRSRSGGCASTRSPTSSPSTTVPTSPPASPARSATGRSRRWSASGSTPRC